MIKRTIEISRQAVHLTCRLGQLLIEPYKDPNRIAGSEEVSGSTSGDISGGRGTSGGGGASVPCEDIGVVMVDHPRTTYSHAALSTLMDQGCALVVCGQDHLPNGMMLPFTSHVELVHRLHDQIEASKPLQKSLWKQIVIAKVKAQAFNLPTDTPTYRKLMTLTGEVKSGDVTNVEAQAAKAYWAAWLDGELFTRRTATNWRAGEIGDVSGETGGTSGGVNAFLNYGYSVLRAGVGRAIVSAGLHPALGIHHCNRSNAFCLADDLMEPLRPMVDRRARELHQRGRVELDQLTKAYLLQILAEPIGLDQQDGPLMVQLHRYVASFVRCLQGKQKKLSIPFLLKSDG